MVRKDDCLCGRTYWPGIPAEQALHRSYHETYVNGPRCAALTRLPAFLDHAHAIGYLLERHVPRWAWAAVRRLSYRARAEVGGLTPYFVPGDEEDFDAVALVRDGRGVGFLTIRRQQYAVPCRWISPHEAGDRYFGEREACYRPLCQQEDRGAEHAAYLVARRQLPVLTSLWVLPDLRGQGLAGTMVRGYLQHHGLGWNQVGWLHPISLRAQPALHHWYPETVWIA